MRALRVCVGAALVVAGVVRDELAWWRDANREWGRLRRELGGKSNDEIDRALRRGGFRR